MEGYTVGQAPAVAGCGVLASSEKSQVATVSIQVLMLLCCEIHSGLIWAWVDGEHSLTHPLGCLS